MVTNARPISQAPVPSAQAPFTIDSSVIKRLTNLNDINKLLHETLAKERAIDSDLDKMLMKRGDLERNILSLNASTSEMLELIHADSEQLLCGVQNTAQLAERISSKVRRLDTAQTHVQDTLSRINLILDRTSCINGVQSAMDHEDWEAAAKYIATFMELESQLSGSHNVAEAGQAEEQQQLLLAAKRHLEQVVEARFDDAVARRDQAAALRFARLFAPLGRRQDGLQKFVDYVQLVVSGRARHDYGQVSELLDSGKEVNFVVALKNLFRDLATCVEEHEQTVSETFGREAVVAVVAGVQAECDVHGSRLLQRFLEARRLARMVKEIGSHKRAGTPGPVPSLDHKQVEAHISEVVDICRCSEEFCQFMVCKMQEAVAPDVLSPVRENALRSGQFATAVRELVGAYMTLEGHYMEETCAMAVRIDELAPGALTSSMVDDVFFILRKCGMRCLASNNVQCVAALLAQLNELLGSTFRSALQAQLQGGPARLLAAAPGAGTGPPAAELAGAAAGAGAAIAAGAAAGHEYAAALNNTDVSADYVTKLKLELEQYLAELFTQTADRERVKSVLSDLHKTSSDFRQMSTRALEQLSEALLPRLRAPLDEVGSLSYQMSEAEYAAAEVEAGWVARLVAATQANTQWLVPLLTANSYEGMFHLIVDKLVQRLEVLLGRKQFNQLGGLQLDRDMRALVAQLSELTGRTVRDKLARLNQMAIILSLESVDEFLDYWGDESGHITWRLTPAEVRAILQQRGDFARESIMALQL